MRADSSSVRWHAGALNNGVVFGATYHLVRRLPKAVSYAVNAGGTWLACQTMQAGTAAIIDNLRAVRPEAPLSELKSLAQRTYRSYGLDTIDFIRSLTMTRRDLEPLVDGLNTAVLEGLLRVGKGVIIVGGHFGNWELGGVVLRLLRQVPLAVVGRAEPSPLVGRIRRHMRESLGIDTIEIGHAMETALTIRRALAANGLVAMLLDRHLGRDRVDVSFFGRPAAFLRTPAMIGYMAGAPLLPAFMIRQPDHTFRGVFGDPIVLDTSVETAAAVARATQCFATQLEDRIREHPHLWYQFYRYWDSVAPVVNR
jgi:KDO2-lipid IV(A) lauroyltransferase